MSNIGNHLLPSNNRSLLVQKKKSMNTPGHYWRKYGECAAILGDPEGGVGGFVGPGEKARRKFSSTGGKAPGYQLSPAQTVKQMLAPDWAQKMLCIIVPNRRTASPEFFS